MGGCNTQFPTPMSYEKHLCSIKHLLNELDPNAASEAAAEVVEDDTNEKSNKDDQEASDDDFDFNPDDFITLDEVGDDEDQDEPQDEPQDESQEVLTEAGDEEKFEIEKSDEAIQKDEIKDKTQAKSLKLRKNEVEMKETK